MVLVGSPIVILGLVVLGIVSTALGVWVGLDARARGSSHPVTWAVLAVLSGVVLLYYVLWWRRRRDRDYPQPRREYYAEVVAAASLGGFVVGATVSPPDPFTQILVWPASFALCLPVVYVLLDPDQPATRETA